MTKPHTPKTIQGYGKTLDVHPAVWDRVLAQAKENKTWALNHKHADNPDAWPASSMSIEMLHEHLTKPVQQLAEEGYAYFHHRAHAISTGYMGGHLDPAAARDWQELTCEPTA